MTAGEAPWAAEARTARLHDAAKRIIDVGAALAMIVGLSPLWMPAALAVRLTSPGPVFHRAGVVGKDGRRFVYYKFRSMYVNNDDTEQRRFRREFIRTNAPFRVERGDDGEERAVYKVVDDPRITPAGRIIRKLSVDELPQLINVLRGEMSLVGPRPPLSWEVAYYEPWHWERLAVKPGLTGLAQVRSRSGLPFDEMARIDIAYVRRRSLWLDLVIMLRTPLAMLREPGRN